MSEIRPNNTKVSYSQIVHELVWEASSLGICSQLEVISESMVPFLALGDKVIVQKIQPESLQIGDLIVVSRKNALITHRLVRKRDQLWITKGDRFRHFDSPVSKKAILGKVIAIDRQGQVINLQSSIWRLMNRLLGWMNWIQGLMFRYLRSVKNWVQFNR